MRSLSLIPIHTRGAGLLAGVADFCDEILHENLVSCYFTLELEEQRIFAVASPVSYISPRSD